MQFLNRISVVIALAALAAPVHAATTVKVDQLEVATDRAGDETDRIAPVAEPAADLGWLGKA